MKSRKGIVISIENRNVSIITQDGEFTSVCIDKKKTTPSVGEEYEGILAKNSIFNNDFSKYIAACLIFLIILSGGSAYAYYMPVSTVVLNTDNPNVELKLNRWGKVIDAKALNKDGDKILKEINIKNNSVNKALIAILEKGKKDKFLNEDYMKGIKTITLDIKGKKDVNLSEFKKEIDKGKLNLVIDRNGTTIFNKTNSDKNYNDADKKTKEPIKSNEKSSVNNGLIDNKNDVNNNEETIQRNSVDEKSTEENDKSKKLNGNSNIKEDEKKPADAENANSNKEDKIKKNESKKDKNLEKE
ncbi:hypothetical protein HBE96_08195 [Clostridium sp. P21]|uniref:RsgI N-terminal anti-sigma domain-containing protein n=1 Tax=Clostridium muellerianum TaxID=2716538 RepID=A0A7Y0EFR3_9CLOT|nr:hypothetical protein [Clostridium muellerianum]NMM62674.1 hypothetical protein [Clostridium muellerianum]